MTEIEKSLGKLAEEINAEHRACETAATAALEHAMIAGELLSEAKSRLPHGEWGAWIKENFAGSDRTARAYMRVHAHRDELEAKRQRSATLSLDGALRELGTPKEKPSYLAHGQALGGAYEAAEALREIADANPTRLAGAVEKLAHPHAEERISAVLGFAWEKAFQEYRFAVLTDGEGWRLRTLRAFDRYVRPIDLLPSRLRFAFEDELTYREMHTTFADLIDGGHVADHTAVAHHIRVMRNLHSEGLTQLAMQYFHALDKGTVRPVTEEEGDEEEGE